MSGTQAFHSQKKRRNDMAREQKMITTCDRHGGMINEKSEFLHIQVTPGKTKRGRKTKQELDLCEACSKAFLEFMEGPTANQKVAEGMI
jgi:hypothetical protein